MADININNRVFDMFNNKTAPQSAESFLTLVRDLNAENSANGKSFGEALTLLNRMKMFSNWNNINQTLLSAIDILHRAIAEEGRTNKLLAILGAMLCYWHLGEKDAVKRVQKDAALIEFNKTWWERNGEDVQKVGGFVAGLAIALVGGNPIGGESVAAGGSRMGNSDKERLFLAETEFTNLKNAITRINFG